MDCPAAVASLKPGLKSNRCLANQSVNYIAAPAALPAVQVLTAAQSLISTLKQPSPHGLKNPCTLSSVLHPDTVKFIPVNFGICFQAVLNWCLAGGSDGSKQMKNQVWAGWMELRACCNWGGGSLVTLQQYGCAR